MEYIGLWKVKGMMVPNENDEIVFKSPEELMAAAEDPHEMAELAQMVGMLFEVREDGFIYSKMMIPDGATQEEIDEAIASGEVQIEDGFIIGEKYEWELCDGDLYMNSHIEGTVFDEPADPWCKLSEEDGTLQFMFTVFERAE